MINTAVPPLINSKKLKSAGRKQK